MIVDKPKMVDKLVTAAMLTIAVSLFLSMSNKTKPQGVLESYQTAAQPVQFISTR